MGVGVGGGQAAQAMVSSPWGESYLGHGILPPPPPLLPTHSCLEKKVNGRYYRYSNDLSIGKSIQ